MPTAANNKRRGGRDESTGNMADFCKAFSCIHGGGNDWAKPQKGDGATEIDPRSWGCWFLPQQETHAKADTQISRGMVQEAPHSSDRIQAMTEERNCGNCWNDLAGWDRCDTCSRQKRVPSKPGLTDNWQPTPKETKEKEEGK